MLGAKVHQGILSPVSVQREQFSGSDPQLVHRHSAGSTVPDWFIDAFS